MKLKNCKLIIDAREKNVIRHQHELSKISTMVKQITTGDYAICVEKDDSTTELLAIIERKSMEDYAASLKDGRSGNISKLLSLRTSTKCRIIYIIECPDAFPEPNKLYGNIQYKCIQSSIFHHIVRDGVCVIQTKDTLHTAKTLVQLMNSMDTLVEKATFDKFQCNDDARQSINTNNTNDNTNSTDLTISGGNDILQLLTEKKQKSNHDIVRELWSCFSGIAMETADDFIKHFTLAEIICGKNDSFKTMKMSTGRAISKKVVKSLSHIDAAMEARLLSKVPEISLTTAKDILENTTLKQLLTFDSGAISIRKVGKLKKNLGEKRAQKILELFHYKYVD